MAKNSGNEPNFNPYAPPLCDLVVDPSHFQSEAIDPQIIELLNELQRSPIVVSSHVEEYVNSAIGPASTRKVGEDAGVLYGLVLLLLIALLLVPATRIVGVLLLLFLAAAQIFPRGKWQNPRYKTCVSPAGVYVWLITEGGVLITTPSNAQWGIPWSHIAKITSIPAGWCLETCADSRNTWHMPVTGIRSDDSALFLQIAQFIRQLNQESRPHPILSAQSAVWSDQRTRSHEPRGRCCRGLYDVPDRHEARHA